jgi:aminoglycoside phosphotransferase (APT) family kinase protein
MQLIGEGKTARVYREGDVAVKLYLSKSAEEVRAEAARQSAAVRAGLPVPEVYGVEETGGGVALRMRCVVGKPLGQSGEAIDEALQTLVGLQMRMHASDAPDMPTLAARLRARVEGAAGLSKRETSAVLARLTQLDRGAKKLCHGDFHPLNVLFDGQKHWIIDWVDAAVGEPSADACRTYLLLRLYSEPLAEAYLRAYTEAARTPRANILAWLPLVAAVRLSEGVGEEERAILLKLAREGL